MRKISPSDFHQKVQKNMDLKTKSQLTKTGFLEKYSEFIYEAMGCLHAFSSPPASSCSRLDWP